MKAPGGREGLTWEGDKVWREGGGGAGGLGAGPLGLGVWLEKDSLSIDSSLSILLGIYN